MDAGTFVKFHEYLTYGEPEFFHVSKISQLIFLLAKKSKTDQISVKLAFNEEGEVELANLEELYFTYDKGGNIVLKFTDNSDGFLSTLTLKKDTCISIMLNGEIVGIFDSSKFDNLKSIPKKEQNKEFYRLFKNEQTFNRIFKYIISYPIRPETPEPKFIPEYIKNKLSSNFLKSSKMTVRRKEVSNG